MGDVFPESFFDEIDIDKTQEITLERWNEYMRETHETMELHAPGSGDAWIQTLMDGFRKASMTVTQREENAVRDETEFQECLK